jgi:Na+/H+ antiporter NhaD/arsenite permease-like protein
LQHPQHIFLFSALASQVMSNVPATLLFAEFTNQWQALLWGASVGGFGTLVASLANLIAWRLYVRNQQTANTAGFTLAFLALGFTAFFAGLLLYRLVSA